MTKEQFKESLPGPGDLQDILNENIDAWVSMEEAEKVMEALVKWVDENLGFDDA